MEETIFPSEWICVFAISHIFIKYVQHIPQHSSLPVLRLTPNDRPLFVCENCSSANVYLPLCVWCRWTSSSATEEFEKKTPRPRTLSAPKFSSDLIQRKRTDRKRRVGIVIGAVASQRDSMDSELSTEPPRTPQSATALIGLGEEACSYEQIDSMLCGSLDQTISVNNILRPIQCMLKLPLETYN